MNSYPVWDILGMTQSLLKIQRWTIMLLFANLFSIDDINTVL